MIVRDQCGLCFDNGHVVRLRSEELHWRGMADKMAQKCIGNADDMEKKICYTYIVYKWVLRNLLVFLFSGKEFNTMKYCPYCGGELANPAASFCTECGKSLSSAVPEERRLPKRTERRKEAANET